MVHLQRLINSFMLSLFTHKGRKGEDERDGVREKVVRRESTGERARELDCPLVIIRDTTHSCSTTAEHEKF